MILGGKLSYIDIALEEKPAVFSDIKEILESFDNS